MGTQDFGFRGCCDGTCTSINTVPADLNTSIPVTGPILTGSLRTACPLAFCEFLGSEYSLQNGIELCPSITDSLVYVELSIFHRSGKCCLFGSSADQCSPILCVMYHGVASSLWHVSLFCVINVSCSGLTPIRSSSSALLGVSTRSSVPYFACQCGLDENLLVFECTLEMVIASSFS